MYLSFSTLTYKLIHFHVLHISSLEWKMRRYLRNFSEIVFSTLANLFAFPGNSGSSDYIIVVSISVWSTNVFEQVSNSPSNIIIYYRVHLRVIHVQLHAYKYIKIHKNGWKNDLLSSTDNQWSDNRRLFYKRVSINNRDII